MDIVEEDDERLLGRERLEVPADRPGDLLRLRARGSQPERPGQQGDDRVTVVSRGEQRLELLPRTLGRAFFADPGGLAHDLGHRPEGDPAAVRQAVPAQHAGPRAQPHGELLDQPRLPYAGRAHHRQQLARPLLDRTRESPVEHPQLLEATHERRADPPHVNGGHRRSLEQPVGRHGPGVAVAVRRLDRLDHHRIPDQVAGRLADAHVAGLRLPFKSRRDRHRVADDERLARFGSGDDLTGVDAGARFQPHAPALLHFPIQHPEPAPCRAPPGPP